MWFVLRVLVGDILETPALRDQSLKGYSQPTNDPASNLVKFEQWLTIKFPYRRVGHRQEFNHFIINAH